MHMKALGLLKFYLHCFLFLLLLPVLLRAEDAKQTRNTTGEAASVSYSDLYVKVQLDKSLKFSKLKPRDVVQGKLSRSVYSGGRQLLPAGSPVNLVVDKLERRRRAPNDHWPWVIKVFAPRHEKYPTFQSAQVLLAAGRQVHLRVSLVSIGQEVEVLAKARKGKSERHPLKSLGPPTPTWRRCPQSLRRRLIKTLRPPPRWPTSRQLS